MSDHEASRGIAAMPEIVLNTAADPGQVKAWLTDVVGVRPEEVRCHVDRPRVELEWPSGQAELRAETSGAGASVVHLRLSATASSAELARAALDALAVQVGQNFNPG
ncbi:hypothetical protein GCM10027445_02950 [Amycolatopsis endophytica]|uniref:Uncharacterized protein n=1 Tax=Amycolatopsis endophytica TaxID=860233 RepID=A0A853BAC8_9PSEU|nr:hypothetical protein [Amycolatopsis endophytica]NYI91366.1 hypothetical protein [Amycolatopsis endophytica]